VCEICLHGVVCIDKPELCVKIGHFNVVCRERPELWVTVGYMKLCVCRDLNCERQLVICCCA